MAYAEGDVVSEKAILRLMKAGLSIDNCRLFTRISKDELLAIVRKYGAEDMVRYFQLHTSFSLSDKLISEVIEELTRDIDSEVPINQVIINFCQKYPVIDTIVKLHKLNTDIVDIATFVELNINDVFSCLALLFGEEYIQAIKCVEVHEPSEKGYKRRSLEGDYDNHKEAQKEKAVVRLLHEGLQSHRLWPYFDLTKKEIDMIISRYGLQRPNCKGRPTTKYDLTAMEKKTAVMLCDLGLDVVDIAEYLCTCRDKCDKATMLNNVAIFLSIDHTTYGTVKLCLSCLKEFVFVEEDAVGHSKNICQACLDNRTMKESERKRLRRNFRGDVTHVATLT